MEWEIKYKYARCVLIDHKWTCEINECSNGRFSLSVMKNTYDYKTIFCKDLKRKTIKAACKEATGIIIEYIEKLEATEL